MSVAMAGLGSALYRYASREKPRALVNQSAQLTRVTTSGRARSASALALAHATSREMF
jgi:hypothetical protein